MATSIAVSKVESEKTPAKIFDLVPGILLLAGVGYAGKSLEKFLNTYAKAHHWTFPNIEYVLWAILIGLVISNVLTVPKIFQPGIATYEFWLKVGIVLLGSRFVIATAAWLDTSNTPQASGRHRRQHDNRDSSASLTRVRPLPGSHPARFLRRLRAQLAQ